MTDYHKYVNKWMNKWMHGWMDGQMDGYMDVKKSMDGYPQCYSAEMSNVGGTYIKKGIFYFLLKNFCI